MKRKFILDPLWITKGGYLDSEYFTYILMDASLKYRKEIEEGKIDHFYEVLFHSLNLNSLAVTGNLYSSKFKPMSKGQRLLQIREELNKIYRDPSTSLEITEIFRSANYLFLNLLIEYLELHADVLEGVKIFFLNKKIQLEPEMFIITQQAGADQCKVWRLEFDTAQDFGYSFAKIKNVEIGEFSGDAPLSKIKNSEPSGKLQKLDGAKNVIFAILEKEADQTTVAKALKNIALLNRGISKKTNFTINIGQDIYDVLSFEKILPFTLADWTD